MSTALLCIGILNGRSNDTLLRGRTQTLKKLGPELDAPQQHPPLVQYVSNDQTQTNERHYNRRTISSQKVDQSTFESNNFDQKGVAWLMVSLRLPHESCL